MTKILKILTTVFAVIAFTCSYLLVLFVPGFTSWVIAIMACTLAIIGEILANING